MESPWKGLSGMDAARAAMGQGWPFAACLCNSDGANEPGAKRRAGCRGKRFWLLLSRLTKVTRPAGRNQCSKQPVKQQRHGRKKHPRSYNSHNPPGTAITHSLTARTVGSSRRLSGYTR